jgi:hypothetical protein
MLVREGRLAARPVLEADAVGRKRKLGGQEPSQEPARADVARAVPLEVKP